MSEQDLIKRFFHRHTDKIPNLILGPGDDAALIQPKPGYELATSIDTMVAGINFPENTQPKDVAYKAIAVSLSDMAAMGAEPKTALLSLTLPSANETWLTDFSNGLFEILDAYQVTLMGGDMTKGPLSVTTVLNGMIPQGQAILRSNAKAGDKIYVTGNLGDAGLALQKNPPSDCLEKLNRPIPRITAGIALRQLASAAIDISDGLATDLEKLCLASQVGAVIHVEQIPRNKASIEMALTAGDDFELCFTISANRSSELDKAFHSIECPYQQIGDITAEKAVKLQQPDGSLLKLRSSGYDHFEDAEHKLEDNKS